MRVLFIAGSDINVHPNHRSHHFIRFLEKHAERVDVISMTRFYSGRHSASILRRFWCGLHKSEGKGTEVIVRDRGIQLKIKQLPGRLDPLVQDLWAYLHLQTLKGLRYDVCIFGNPENALLAYLLKRRGVVQSVIYDDWDYYLGFDQSRFWKILINWRERVSVAISDAVISVGNLLAEYRRSQGAKRSFVIPNGVDYQLFANAQKKRPHPETLVYVGKLAKEYGVDVTIRGFASVLEEIRTARYLIISYSEGPYGDYLKRLASELGLSENINFLGSKSYEDLPYYLAEADIGIALFRPNELRKFAFPLKVVEYMAAGLAVIGADYGETGTLIRDSRCGRHIACEPEEFGRAGIEMLTQRRDLARYQSNASHYARRYEWDKLFSDLPAIIDCWPASTGNLRGSEDGSLEIISSNASDPSIVEYAPSSPVRRDD